MAAILIIHGGGWNAGSKNDIVYRALMVDYAMKGYVVANMNYRLTREAPFPACIEDVRCAIRWMKANADKLGIDPERIGTYGHSAGGHLSLMAGVAADSIHVTWPVQPAEHRPRRLAVGENGLSILNGGPSVTSDNARLPSLFCKAERTLS